MPYKSKETFISDALVVASFFSDHLRKGPPRVWLLRRATWKTFKKTQEQPCQLQSALEFLSQQI